MGLFADLPTQVSIERQIECVQRELGFRRRVYSRRVAEERMSLVQADEEIACMEAVLATLQAVKTNA
jgi:hypothetical protein